MKSSRVFRMVACLRAATIAVMLVVVTRATVARADNVDELVRQLDNDDSDKVRLSAALNLSRLGNARAILPLAGAVERDRSESVRAAAAVGLGRLVTDKTEPRVKAKAIAALTRAK
ncbi:MAG TPA: HEAT repeat domain-containing protein, partial [Kofleriaceae bacterium]